MNFCFTKKIIFPYALKSFDHYLPNIKTIQVLYLLSVKSSFQSFQSKDFFRISDQA